MEHSFDIEIAKKYGVNAAILYINFQFWIAKNKANGRNFRNGRTWTYNSMRALLDLFPYLSKWDIRQALKKLLDAKVLLKGNYNVNGYDRTTWYAFSDEKTALKSLPAHLWNSQMEDVKSTNGARKKRKPIPNPIPDKEPDINNNVEISPEERLKLDLHISQERKFFMEQLSLIFHPTRREATTFANITKYLVNQCQTLKLPVSIFKDAINWAKEAKASTVANKKGLFVAKVKKQTGFRKQSMVLKKSGNDLS